MNVNTYEQGRKDLEQLLDEIRRYPHLYVYSAGNRAKELVQMRKIGFLDLPAPECFLVTGMQGNRESIDNPEDIAGIPVYTLQTYRERQGKNMPETEETAVLVAAMEHYHKEISESLSLTSLRHIFYLTDVMERILIADCMKYYYEKLGLEFRMTEMLPIDEDVFPDKNANISAMTYMVQCAGDVKLAENKKDRKWELPLQAGAALTDKRIAELTDAEGENISEKNAYYNEMTGIYWLWKNTNWDYSGICHYRRQFESDIVWKYILDHEADVILPTPALVYPDLEGYYLNWGERSYYKTMLQVIKEQHSDYYETALWCASHPIFYPNNIFIAQRKILERYCKFAFSVIDEVEERMKYCGGKKQKRCWLSEHVTTIYFMKHHSDYKIVFSNLRRYW